MQRRVHVRAGVHAETHTRNRGVVARLLVGKTLDVEGGIARPMHHAVAQRKETSIQSLTKLC